MGTVSSESPKVQYSVQREQSDGSLNRISVRVPYFSKDDIHVYVDDVEINSSASEQSTYTWRWDGDYIAITPNVASGSEVLVRRITPINEAIHIFDGRSEFDDQSMDENFQQLIYIAQEYSEGSGIKDVFSDINMHGYKITNVGQATNDDDVVTYGQYKQDAEGAKVAMQKAEAAASKAEQHEKNTKAIADKAQTDITASKEQAIVEITQRVAPEIDKAKVHATTAQSAAGTAVSASNRSEIILQHVQLLEDESELHAQTAEDAKSASEAILDELKDGLDNLLEVSEPIKIVAENINHVVTDSANISNINTVAADLEGASASSLFDDYGDLGNPGDSGTSIIGGNIKTVSDNIEHVRTNSQNITDIKKVATEIDRIPETITTMEGLRDEATASKNLAKAWANKTTGTVDGSEYSAKYYANEAKKNADKTNADLSAITTARDNAVKAVNDAGDDQIVLIESEGDTQTQRVTATGVEQVGAVEIKGTQVTGNVTAEGTKQIQAIQAQTNTVVQKVTAEGTKQVGLVSTQGTTSVNAVKAQQTTSVNAVVTQQGNSVKAVQTQQTTSVNAVTAEGTKQVGLVTTEGTKQVDLAKAQVTLATQKASEASQSASTATAKATIATQQATLATTKASEAEDSATAASADATKAKASATNAANSASTATAQATAASNSAKAAKLSEDNAALSKTAAGTSETNAKASEVEAKKQADLAKGYAEQAASGQINSDWAETSATSKAFIKNKPTLGTLASKNSIAYTEVTGTPNLSVYVLGSTLTAELAKKANLSHTHTTAQITGLDTALAGKAPTSHTHTSANITDLSTTLAPYATTAVMNTELGKKAPASHTHTVSQITNLTTTLAPYAKTADVNTGLAKKLDITTFNGFIDYGDLGS